MKNKIYLLLIFLMIALKGWGQEATTQTATLIKGDGTTTIYYGANALKSALNNTDDGSRILLSSGNFNSFSSISRNVTITGVGYEINYANNKVPTYINGGIGTTYSDKGNGLIFENMYINGNVTMDMNSSPSNIIIRNCYIAGGIINRYAGGNEGFLITNSIIEGTVDNPGTKVNNSIIGGLAHDNSELTGIVSNSIIYQLNDVQNVEFYNNIILSVHEDDPNWVRTNCTAYNNLVPDAKIFSSIPDQMKGGNYTASIENIFVSKNDTMPSLKDDYHLKTPEAYKGTDDTQVGIYGGETPFTSSARKPRITSSSIDWQTDAKGCLKFSVTVEAQ